MALKEKVYQFNGKMPRLGKKEFATTVLSHDLYKRAISESPEFAHLSWKEFQKIWVEIAEELKNEICTNPLGVKLPFFLGDLKVQYLPYKRENQDALLSAQLGEPIPHLNLHSKGKAGKLIWERKDARRFNRSLDLWAFEAADLFEDQVGSALKQSPDKFRISRTRVANKRK